MHLHYSLSLIHNGVVLLFQRKTETQASFIQILYFFGTTIDPVRAFEKMREERES